MTVAISHRINGKPWAGTASRHGDVFDPATGAVTGRVDLASSDVVDEAVAAAVAVASEWGSSSLARRAAVLFEFRRLMADHAADVAAIVCSEHGKVRDDAMGEVARGLDVVDFACGIPTLLKGGYSENVSTNVDTFSIQQPLGVVAGITPFNFPVMVPLWMFPIAVAAGNAFVLKPSERDPSAANFLAELMEEAGLPPGVLNVVHGDKEAVTRLVEHPDVAAVSFVGSTPVARFVYETATRHGKRAQALGGAKNHMVVLPDADMELAADAIVSAAYGSSGERCMAVSVVVAVGRAGDEVVARVRERAAALTVGSADAEGSDMGPLITREHRDRVESYIEAATEEGAAVVLDGRRHPVHGDPGGFWTGPSLVDGVTPDMSVYRDEIFGPVLSVARVGTYDEAVALVNRNPYGNGAAIFTNDGRAARRFQHEVLAGMVGINVAIPVPVSHYSFGGWKSSLFGDSHIYGADGVRFYTRTKVVTARWSDPGGVHLGFPPNM